MYNINFFGFSVTGEPALVRTGSESVGSISYYYNLKTPKVHLFPLTKMSNTTIPEFNILEIAGNAPDDIKLRLGDIPRFFNYGSKRLGRQQMNTFGKAIELRLKLTELSIISKAEEPSKLEGRAVLEIDVAEGKVNESNSLLTIPYIRVSLSFSLLLRYGQYGWKYSWRMFGVFN